MLIVLRRGEFIRNERTTMGLIDLILRRSRTSAFAQHNDDESIYYISVDEVKKYLPHYSIAEAEIKFEELCKMIVESGQLKKWQRNGYYLVQCVLEELFWDYCFNMVKYQEFINEHGLNIKVRQGSYWKINGLLRVNQWFEPAGFIESIKTYLRIPIFILYICFTFLTGRKNKVWVDAALKNFRYSKLQIPDSTFIILNRLSCVWGRKKAANNILDAIEGVINKKTCMWWLWVFAIKLLKPKKIIVKDNLFPNSSLLVAAKITGCEIIGVAHGSIPRFSKGMFGSKVLEGYLNLKYDKYYVWDEVFKKQLITYGNIYDSKEIVIAGWLQTFNYQPSKRISNKYVLYPYEHFTDYRNISKCLNSFISLGYDVVIKRRPNTTHYPIFGINNNIVWVDDFTQDHIDNAICVFAAATTLAFDLCNTRLPVLIPRDSGMLLLFDNMQVENFIFFDTSELNDIHKLLKRYDERKSWKTPDISSVFLAEFRA